MFTFTYGNTNDLRVTVYGTNYLLLEMEENVKEVNIDLKEVKDDGKELKQEVRHFRGEVKHELRGIKDNLQAAAAAGPSKLFLHLVLDYSLKNYLDIDINVLLTMHTKYKVLV